MSDDRRENNSFVAFLIGFALGALLAGGGVGAFFVVQSERWRAEAQEAQARAHEMMALAEMERARAEEAARRADDARRALEKDRGKR